jgi:proteic killer suppression protein
MIRGFRHKGLRRLFEEGDSRGVQPQFARKLRNILTFLNVASEPAEAAPLPGLKLQALRGDLKGMWSITVSGNWRVIFRFSDGDAHDGDLVNYH